MPEQHCCPFVLPQALLQCSVPSQKVPASQVLPGVQQASPTCPQNENEPCEPDAMQFASAPYIVSRTPGVTAVVMSPSVAPVTAAVAQTFARARVSEPIACPEM